MAGWLAGGLAGPKGKRKKKEKRKKGKKESPLQTAISEKEEMRKGKRKKERKRKRFVYCSGFPMIPQHADTIQNQVRDIAVHSRSFWKSRSKRIERERKVRSSQKSCSGAK